MEVGFPGCEVATAATAQRKFGFLGAGRMATALAQGFLAQGLASKESMVAGEPYAAAAEDFARRTGSRTTKDNVEVVAGSDVLFLAVKPQHVPEVLTGLKGRWRAEQLVISIAAGVRLATLADLIGAGPRLVRVMPNTPCLVGESASAYSLGATATPADAELVAKLLGAVGRAWQVPESSLDAVTGLSGSGPAFIYVMIEALSDGGVQMGLPRDLSTSLAAQTVLGAAKMVLETGEHPGVLKDQVTSPGGTTIAGLAALESGGLRSALISAVEAATRRSQELGHSA